MSELSCENANLEELIQMRWMQLSPECLNRVCERLKTLCPHECVVDDYIDLDCERGGIYIKYCKTCWTSWK